MSRHLFDLAVVNVGSQMIYEIVSRIPSCQREKAAYLADLDPKQRRESLQLLGLPSYTSCLDS